jgi:hypothetical protein
MGTRRFSKLIFLIFAQDSFLSIRNICFPKYGNIRLEDAKKRQVTPLQQYEESSKSYSPRPTNNKGTVA